MRTLTTEDIKRISREVYEKTLENSSYRQLFVKDPEGYLAKEFDVVVPENVKIVVVEEEPTEKIEGEVYLLVPIYQGDSDVELTDQELDTVAGGTSVPMVTPTIGSGGLNLPWQDPNYNPPTGPGMLL